jgi:hypothetical protein
MMEDYGEDDVEGSKRGEYDAYVPLAQFPTLVEYLSMAFAVMLLFESSALYGSKNDSYYVAGHLSKLVRGDHCKGA